MLSHEQYSNHGSFTFECFAAYTVCIIMYVGTIHVHDYVIMYINQIYSINIRSMNRVKINYLKLHAL